MQISKCSELLNRDILSQIRTNIEGQLSFNNLNKIEWNNFDSDQKAGFFMRHVYHDGVDPRIKNQINKLVNEYISKTKHELLTVEPLNPLLSTSFADKSKNEAEAVTKVDASEQLLKKVDLKLRNEAMVCVIKDLVDEIHFYEI